MSTCHDDILLKPNPLAELLGSLPEKSGRWQLSIQLPSDKGRLDVKASLTSIPKTGLFSERAKMIFEKNGEYAFKLEGDVDGEMSLGAAEFDVHVLSPQSRFPSLFCTVKATTPGEAYDGNWTAPCMDPEGCNCDGLKGTVSLVLQTMASEM